MPSYQTEKRNLKAFFTVNNVDLILFLVFLFFMPMAYGAVEIWSITIVHIVSIILLILWITKMLRKEYVTIYGSPIDLSVFLFLGLAFISLSYSVYPYASRIFLYKIITYLIIFYFLINNIREGQKLLWLIWAIALFGGMYAFFGLILVSGRFVGFKIFSPDHYNISFNFVNHNHFAGFLEPIVWLSIGLSLAYNGQKRILLLVISVYSAIAIVFSLSRGGIIGFIGGGFFLITMLLMGKGLKKKSLLVLIFSLIVILSLIILGLNPVVERLETIGDPWITGRSRIEIWKGTLALMARHPWRGTGIGTYIYTFPAFKSAYLAKYFVNHAHNDYLELFAEIGLLGMIPVLAGIAFFFFFSIKKLLYSDDQVMKTIGLGGLAGCFSLFVHACTDFNFYIPSNIILLLTIISIIIIITLSDKDKDDLCLIHKRLSRPMKWLLSCFFLILLIIFLVLILTPYIGKVYSIASQECINNGDFERSFQFLRKAIFYDFGNSEHFSAMGDLMALRADKAYEKKEKETFLLKSIDYYDQAIKRCPVESYFHTKKGFSLTRIGRLPEAEETFLKAISLAPMDAMLHYDLGNLYLKKGENIQAYKEFKRFLSLDLQYVEMVLNELWDASLRDEDFEKILPEKAEIRKKYARFLFKKGKDTQGINELAYAFFLEPTAANAILHLQETFKRQKNKESLLLGKHYLEEFKDDPPLKKLMATMYKELGLIDEAIVLYNEMLDKDPADSLTYILLANAYSEKKDFNTSIETLNNGLKKRPHDPQLYYRLGLIYRNMNRPEEAFKFLKKAVLYAPEKWIHHYQLGVEYYRNGLYQEAVDEWKRCLELDPNNKRCDQSIQGVYKKIGLM